MTYGEEKVVRFQDQISERSLSSKRECSTRDGEYSRQTSSSFERMRDWFRWGSGRFKSIRKSFNFRSSSSASATDTNSSKKVLDPQGLFLQRWNKIFMISCVLAVYLDPLFFYIPVVDRKRNCLDLDKKLQITACILRSFTDIFYILHIVFQFHTGFIAPSSRVFGRGVLVEDLGAIAKRYLSSYFLIDILAVLPLPQLFYTSVMGFKPSLDYQSGVKATLDAIQAVISLPNLLVQVFLNSEMNSKQYFKAFLRKLESASIFFFLPENSCITILMVVILVIIPELRGSVALRAKNMLRTVVFFQYFPRLFRIYPLYKEVTRTAGIITETTWVGAAFNLFLYMLASHIFGAYWYLFSIEREDTCWRDACKRRGCNLGSLYCGSHSTIGGNTFLNDSCPIAEANTTLFDFGIYSDALKSEVVETRDFPKKLFYCLWWGLRNLSSLGQNLQTSTYVWEIIFAVAISIFGLVLFSLLIGNMQTYLQSNTIRLEEMRVKRRDAEQWMSHRLLPEDLKERIRRYEQYKWQETRGVDEENLLRNLPKDLKRDIKRHLCLSLLMRVPMFEKMDEQLLDAMCDRLKPVLYTENSFIIREGDPVDEMLLIMRGKLLSETTNGGRTGFFNSDYLKAGDFCGEELLTWALDPHTSSNLPISTRTVHAVKEVEAFALMADDLRFVASQFRRLHSKQLRHTFRLYSQQWRTWAACFIQAAWRRYYRKKQEEFLHEGERKLQDALAMTGGSSPSLGATIYASRFAANALRAIRRNVSRKARLTERLPAMLLQKPAEPDFSSEDH